MRKSLPLILILLLSAPLFAQNEKEEQRLGVLGVVTAKTARIYVDKSTDSGVYFTASEKRKLLVVERAGEWCGILMKNDSLGWIKSKDIDVSAKIMAAGGKVKPFVSAELTALAEKYKDVPYVYGGTSPETGMDCSAFVRMIYADRGIELPRSSRDQALVGESVAFDDLMPGDRVYFAFRGSSVINHAGIYCGGGIFLHCSNAKYGVKLDKITDGTYKNAFAAGRRDIAASR
ncbi:MAG: C40 family peptidase [Abditibacteriota bacterium]|nr:C40 family peptidase [Abditibacteriota bacterium]